MNEAIITATGAIIVALIAALARWIVKARQLSGKIETSDAAALWKEAGLIRNDYRARLAAADARIADLEKRLEGCEAELRMVRS